MPIGSILFSMRNPTASGPPCDCASSGVTSPTKNTTAAQKLACRTYARSFVIQLLPKNDYVSAGAFQDCDASSFERTTHL